MTIRYKTFALALISCLLATPAMADEDREGPYVFVSGGVGMAHNACSSLAIPAGATCSQRSPVFRAGFGWQYTPMWGLEANWGQFGYANTSGSSTFAAPVGASNYAWQLRANGWAVQAVATLHMTDSFAVIAKAGLARVEYDEFLGGTAATGAWTQLGTVNRSTNNPALGAGVQYDLGPHGSIRLMGEYYGRNNIYSIYGQSTKVMLVAGTAALMWRY